MKGCENKSGVTLIEMLVVVAIIALLATLALGIAGSLHRQSNERLTQWRFKLLDDALQQYYDYMHEFPLQPDDNDPANAAAHSELLYAALYGLPACRKILLQVKGNDRADISQQPRIYDAWGSVMDYRYKTGWAFPELVSPGPDKTLGTADDIRSKR